MIEFEQAILVNKDAIVLIKDFETCQHVVEIHIKCQTSPPDPRKWVGSTIDTVSLILN